MLQSQGFGSRKHCQQLIKSGAVSIQDEVVDNPKYNLDLNHLNFKVYGKSHTYREKFISP